MAKSSTTAVANLAAQLNDLTSVVSELIMTLSAEREKVASAMAAYPQPNDEDFEALEAQVQTLLKRCQSALAYQQPELQLGDGARPAIDPFAARD